MACAGGVVASTRVLEGVVVFAALADPARRTGRDDAWIQDGAAADAALADPALLASVTV